MSTGKLRRAEQASRKRSSKNDAARRRDWIGHKPLLVFLAIVVICYTGIAVNHLVNAVPREETSGESGDIASDARRFLKREGVAPLHPAAAANVPVAEFAPVPSQAHPLLAERAPDFTLPDARQERRTLSKLLGRGPVVLVFYYGYHCSHCVAQLFALNDDLQRFRDAGAEVVALSADPVEVTNRKFDQFGRFDFPVLFDAENAVAQQYGVYRPADDDGPEILEHGTFVIGRDGRVLWAYRGAQPFVDNKSLLCWLSDVRSSLTRDTECDNTQD